MTALRSLSLINPFYLSLDELVVIRSGDMISAVDWALNINCTSISLQLMEGGGALVLGSRDTGTHRGHNVHKRVVTASFCFGVFSAQWPGVLSWTLVSLIDQDLFLLYVAE